MEQSALPRRSGKPVLYPVKVRAPISVLLTSKGTDLFYSHLQRTGLGRNDFIEHLIRAYGHQVPAVTDIEAVEITAA